MKKVLSNNLEGKMKKEKLNSIILSKIESKREIGKRFKRFRADIGKTQSQLAEEIDVYQATITNIELGKTFPSIPYIYYFYKHYHLNPSWLLTGIGNIYTAELGGAFEDVKMPGIKSQIPCHVGKDDPMYEKYVEMLDLMRNPLIEQVMMGKLLELKIIAKDEIALFKKNE